MALSRSLLIALLLSLAGCQSFVADRAPSRVATERLQGELRRSMASCSSRAARASGCSTCSRERQACRKRSGAGDRPAGPPVRRPARHAQPARPNETGQFALTRVYRLQREGHGCGEENFKHLILRASGHEPGWTVNVTSRGMLLTRPGQEPVALPYGGATARRATQFHQRGQCTAAGSLGRTAALRRQRQRTVSHLSAELRLDGQTLRGCAYYGGGRDD